jgi:hypothetical protein
LFNHNPLFALFFQQYSPPSLPKESANKHSATNKVKIGSGREMFNADNSFMLQFHVVVRKSFSAHSLEQKPDPEGEIQWSFVCFYAETMEVEMLLCLCSNCFSGSTTEF